MFVWLLTYDLQITHNTPYVPSKYLPNYRSKTKRNGMYNGYTIKIIYLSMHFFILKYYYICEGKIVL